MSGSRGVLAGVAAAAVGAVTAGSFLLSGSSVASAESVCGPPSGAVAGDTYTCDVDGVRATVKVLDKDCVLLVRAVVLNDVTRSVIPGTAGSADVIARRALANARVSVGDCHRQRAPVVVVPVPAPAPEVPAPAPEVPGSEAPVTEAPVPEPVETHLPVTG